MLLFVSLTKFDLTINFDYIDLISRFAEMSRRQCTHFDIYVAVNYFLYIIIAFVCLYQSLPSLFQINSKLLVLYITQIYYSIEF